MDGSRSVLDETLNDTAKQEACILLKRLDTVLVTLQLTFYSAMTCCCADKNIFTRTTAYRLGHGVSPSISGSWASLHFSDGIRPICIVYSGPPSCQRYLRYGP